MSVQCSDVGAFHNVHLYGGNPFDALDAEAGPSGAELRRIAEKALAQSGGGAGTSSIGGGAGTQCHASRQCHSKGPVPRGGPLCCLQSEGQYPQGGPPVVSLLHSVDRLLAARVFGSGFLFC